MRQREAPEPTRTLAARQEEFPVHPQRREPEEKARRAARQAAPSAKAEPQVPEQAAGREQEPGPARGAERLRGMAPFPASPSKAPVSRLARFHPPARTPLVLACPRGKVRMDSKLSRRVRASAGSETSASFITKRCSQCT